MSSIASTISPDSVRLRLIGATLLMAILGRLFVPPFFTSLYQNWTVGESSQGAAGSCLPWSFFLVHHKHLPAHFQPGTLVEFQPPLPMQKLIGRYPVIKMIAAAPGDHIQIRDGALWINGKYWGKTWLDDYLTVSGEPPSVPPSFVVPQGSYLILGTSPESYDGRYWGLVPRSAIDGVARPL